MSIVPYEQHVRLEIIQGPSGLDLSDSVPLGDLLMHKERVQREKKRTRELFTYDLYPRYPICYKVLHKL